MDESWRMRIGVSNGTNPQSTADCRRSSTEYEPEDFNDVFGGPPKSVLARKLSSDFTSNDWFYREVFRQPENEIQVPVAGRRLPEFVIPVDRDSEERPWLKSQPSMIKVKRMSRSKSTSSSVLSFEDEDVGLSSFTSRLRPINVPSRWSSSSKPNKQDLPSFGFPANDFSANNDQCYDYIAKNYAYEFPQRFSSPEAMKSLEPPLPIKDYYDMHLNSPSSEVTSDIFHGLTFGINHNNNLPYQQTDNIEAEVYEEEGTSSCFIEINTQTTKVNNSEAIDINEAVAWAKEKFQGWSLDGGGSLEEDGSNLFEEIQENPSPMKVLVDLQESDCVSEQLSKDKSKEEWTEEKANLILKEEEGATNLDERITKWSTGNETDIRLLLSTLHHILWSSSGWCPVPLTDLSESAKVKKAYQKARLCLHPDKLQQRGATPFQNYVAEKVFSILQDAWAAFTSQNAFFG